MIRIAVIDDEEKILNLICEYIQRGIEVTSQVEICSFLNVDSFWDRVKSGEDFDVLFSDIDLGKDNGIDLGNQISKNYPQIYLIFITSHPEFAAESYVMEAYQYILKQDMERRLPGIVRNLIEKIERERLQYRLVGTETSKEKIFYKDIIYICKMKAAKYVLYITTKGEYRERITLEKVFRELHSDEFVLAERAYIVNMRHIVKIVGNTIYLENQENVVISRARLSKIKEEINAYWRKNSSWK